MGGSGSCNPSSVQDFVCQPCHQLGSESWRVQSAIHFCSKRMRLEKLFFVRWHLPHNGRNAANRVEIKEGGEVMTRQGLMVAEGDCKGSVGGLSRVAN